MTHHLVLRWDTVVLTIETTTTTVWERLDGVLDPIRLRRFSVTPAGPAAAGIPDIVFVGDDRMPEVRRTAPGIRVSGPVGYWLGGERLACCVLQLIDHRRLRDGGLCFHGAAVARDGRAVLLTGPSESGKTSTALTLLNRASRPISLLSNDHVLGRLTADGIALVANPQVSVAFRSEALWLADRGRYRELVGHHPHPVRGRRLRVPADDLGAVPAPTDPVLLDAVVFVGVGTTEAFEAYPTPALRTQTAINADLAGRVRAANLLPLEDDGSLGPMLPDLSDARTELTVERATTALIARGRVFDARGPVDDVAAFVDSLWESA